jgi:uncharacterized ferritin-like protein (DUF455 family)
MTTTAEPGTFAERLINSPSRREPPYRPVMTLAPEERERLAARIGAVQNYQPETLRRLVAADPANIEPRKALVSAIMSAEFAGVDAFARKVVEWQSWPVPPALIMAMARQTWDEVRHAQLAIGLLESYGGQVGEYPDTLAGGQGGPQARENMRSMLGDDPADPLISLSTTNVSLEGAALALFQATSELGRQVGDHLMEHCYDYNWADEVTHTAIGDYFVKQLCEGDPEQERRALAVHARHERMRQALTGEQSEEIRAFFAEEDERGQTALG